MPVPAWVMVAVVMVLAVALAGYLVTVAVLLRRVIGSLEAAKRASGEIETKTEPIGPVLRSIRTSAESLQRLMETRSPGH